MAKVTKETVKIRKELIEKLKIKSREAGSFESVDAYVNHILEKYLSELEAGKPKRDEKPKKGDRSKGNEELEVGEKLEGDEKAKEDVFSEDDEKKIKERLRKLGYLN